MATDKESGQYDKLRILVLEDEPHVRQIICRLLRQIGFRFIYEAENGAEGFKELLRVRPNIILCDIHMEPINGMEFLKRLRGISRKEFSDIPLIFLTADRQSDTVSDAVSHRADGYLSKPISLKLLKERLDIVLFPVTE